MTTFSKEFHLYFLVRVSQFGLISHLASTTFLCKRGGLGFVISCIKKSVKMETNKTILFKQKLHLLFGRLPSILSNKQENEGVVLFPSLQDI